MVACMEGGRGQVFLPQKGPRLPTALLTPRFYEACVPMLACKPSGNPADGLQWVYSLTQLKRTFI